jgi:hypothetical protein
MPKRYHDSKMGMGKGYKGHIKGRADSAQEREKQVMHKEHSMGGVAMIADDWSAPALLPRNVIDRNWPRSHDYDYMGGHINDLFTGVQDQIGDDVSDLRREMNPKKY